eukprot:g1712.t1
MKPDKKFSSEKLSRLGAMGFAKNLAKKKGLTVEMNREGTGIHSTLMRIRDANKSQSSELKRRIRKRQNANGRPENARWPISDKDTWKRAWTIGILILVVYTCVKIPIDFAFPESEESPILDTFIDIAFIVDVGLSFFTSYTDENGEEEFELKLIARNYLKTWFPVDFVACFPLELMLRPWSDGDSDSSRAKLVLRVLKVPRLLRMGRVLKQLNQFHFVTAIKVLKLILTLFFVTHWVGCAFAFICSVEYEAGDSDVWPEFLSEMVQRRSEGGTRYSFVLLNGMYLLLGESIGASTNAERVYVYVSMSLGAILMAVIIGNISVLLQNSGALDAMFSSKIENVTKTMVAMKVSASTRRKTVRYFELLWQRQRCLSTTMSFLEEVSPALRKEISLDLNMEVVHCCDFFCNLLNKDKGVTDIMNADIADHLLVAMVSALTIEIYLEGDVIIQQGETGCEMFFLVRGSVSVEQMRQDKETRTIENSHIVTLHSGAYFGELSLINSIDGKGKRRACSIVAKTDCEVRILSAEKYGAIATDFPEIIDYFEQQADLKYNTSRLKSSKKKRHSARRDSLSSALGLIDQNDLSPAEQESSLKKPTSASATPSEPMVTLPTSVVDEIYSKLSSVEKFLRSQAAASEFKEGSSQAANDLPASSVKEESGLEKRGSDATKPNVTRPCPACGFRHNAATASQCIVCRTILSST